jgi:hypothetical protein
MIKEIGIGKDLERSDGNLSRGLFLQLTGPPGRKKMKNPRFFLKSSRK